MAELHEVKIIDDLTGEVFAQSNGETSEEVLVFRGWVYRMDLGPAGRQQLEDAVTPILGKATKVRRLAVSAAAPVTSATTRRAPTDRVQNQAIREWAAKRGMQVSDRGRIPAEVLEAYHDEN